MYPAVTRRPLELEELDSRRLRPLSDRVFRIYMGALLEWWFLAETEPDAEDKGGMGIERRDAGRYVVAKLYGG